MHPDVFIAHEADVAWLLYCLAHKNALAPYENDGPVGFRKTLEQFGPTILDSKYALPLQGAIPHEAQDIVELHGLSA